MHLVTDKKAVNNFDFDCIQLQYCNSSLQSWCHPLLPCHYQELLEVFGEHTYSSLSQKPFMSKKLILTQLARWLNPHLSKAIGSNRAPAIDWRYVTLFVVLDQHLTLDMLYEDLITHQDLLSSHFHTHPEVVTTIKLSWTQMKKQNINK